MAQADDLRIAACFPRAIKWLFHAAGAELTDGAWRVANMRMQSAQEVANVMLDGIGLGRTAARPDYDSLAPVEGEWVPWFPVIDYSRCQDCRKCLEFCLFGVYGMDEGRVVVREPAKCKTNCPACARLCPNGAIMFPKYPQRPINGDRVRPEDLNRNNMKIDLGKLVDGDVVAKLRARSGTDTGQSLSEMGRTLGIPNSVLKSLTDNGKCGDTERESPCDCGSDQSDPPCKCDCE